MKSQLLEFYRLPSKGSLALFELYALYALWWEEGSGKRTFGYPVVSIQPDARIRTIDDAFESCVHQLSRVMLSEANHAIWEEASEACDEYLIPPSALREWLSCSATPTVRMMFNRHLIRQPNAVDSFSYSMPPAAEFWRDAGYGGACALFNAPFWDEHADSYGGAKWANTTHLVGKLQSAVDDNKPVSDVMYKLDCVYDIEHNTGALANKLIALNVRTEDLDIRARLKSSMEFIPYVGERVASMIRGANQHVSDPVKESVLEIRKFVAALRL